MLTSARCLHLGSETKVYAGVSSFNFDQPMDSQGQIRKVTKMKLHEKFTPLLYEYDVGLASFDEELTFGGNT